MAITVSHRVYLSPGWPVPFGGVGFPLVVVPLSGFRHQTLECRCSRHHWNATQPRPPGCHLLEQSVVVFDGQLVPMSQMLE
jgi:hypothetical protein